MTIHNIESRCGKADPLHETGRLLVRRAATFGQLWYRQALHMARAGQHHTAMRPSSSWTFSKPALSGRSTYMGGCCFRLCHIFFFGGVYSLPSGESLTGSCKCVPNHKQGYDASVVCECADICSIVFYRGGHHGYDISTAKCCRIMSNALEETL